MRRIFKITYGLTLGKEDVVMPSKLPHSAGNMGFLLHLIHIIQIYVNDSVYKDESKIIGL